MVIVSGFASYTVNPKVADEVSISGDEPPYQPSLIAPPPPEFSFARINSPSQFQRSQENLTLAGQLELFKRARHELEAMVAKGIYVRRPQKTIYIYRCVEKTRIQTGIMCCIDSREYENGFFLPNENTLPEKVESIVMATKQIGIYTGFPLAFGHFSAELVDLVQELANPKEMLLEVAKDGVVHQLFATRVDQTERIVKLVGRIPYFCIADGHHRMKAYSKMISEIRRKKPSVKYTENFDFIPVVVFPEEQMKILKFNRVVTQIGEQDDFALLERLDRCFEISEIDLSKLKAEEEGFEGKFEALVAPKHKGEFSFFFARINRWFKLRAKRSDKGPASMESIDTWFLSQHFFTEILGIEDVSTSFVIKYVPETAGNIYSEQRVCEKKQHRVLIICKQLEVADVEHVCLLKESMPPKSTLFYPKPLMGLIFRELVAFD